MRLRKPKPVFYQYMVDTGAKRIECFGLGDALKVSAHYQQRGIPTAIIAEVPKTASVPTTLRA